jgi:hypothetical protein
MEALPVAELAHLRGWQLPVGLRFEEQRAT